jgi:hypothetical protein
MLTGESGLLAVTLDMKHLGIVSAFLLLAIPAVGRQTWDPALQMPDRVWDLEFGPRGLLLASDRLYSADSLDGVLTVALDEWMTEIERGHDRWMAVRPFDGFFELLDGTFSWVHHLESISLESVNESRRFANNANWLFAGGSAGQVFTSPDAGASWVLQNRAYLPVNDDDVIAIVNRGGSLYYIQQSFPNQLRYLNGELVPGGIEPRSMLVDGDEGSPGDTVFVATGRNILFSPGFELSFQQLADVPGTLAIWDFVKRGDDFVVVDVLGSVILSTDGANTWQDISAGITLSDIDLIRLDPEGYVYLINDDLVQKSATPIATMSTSTAADRTVRGAEFGIRDVYPNPARDQLFIKVALPAGRQTRLAIYDALGREVEVMIDGPTSASQVVLEINPRWAPGSYTIAFQSEGGRVDSRPLIYLR